MVSAFPIRPVSQDAVLEALETAAAGLGAKIDRIEARLDAKIDGVESRLTAKIEAVDAKVETLREDVVGLRGAMDENFVELNCKFNLLMAHLNVKDGE